MAANITTSGPTSESATPSAFVTASTFEAKVDMSLLREAGLEIGLTPGGDLILRGPRFLWDGNTISYLSWKIAQVAEYAAEAKAQRDRTAAALGIWEEET